MRAPAAVRAPADGILDAIGDTPLVRLRRILDRPDVAVWAKLESANPGGSMKDRPAAAMIAEALADGRLAPGMTVIESTSGNLGVGLAQACRYHGLRVICVVDSRTTERNLLILRALGADVRIVTEPGPGAGDLLAARRRLVRRLVAETPGGFNPDQYGNRSNPEAHRDGTMREIDIALGGAVDYVFVPTSTTGLLLGCCEYLRALDRQTRVVAVDAKGSALFGGPRGERLLPGLGAGLESELSARAAPDDLVRVGDLDCVVGCRRLVEREAILAGASSGGVVHAVSAYAPRLPAGARCALVLPDGGAGYLATVYDDAWVERELGCGPRGLAGRVAG